MSQVTVYLSEDSWREKLSQHLTLTIDVSITTTREVDTLEGASFQFARLQDLRDTRISFVVYGECLARV